MRLVHRMRDIHRKNKPTSTVLLRSWSINAQQKRRLRFKVYKPPSLCMSHCPWLLSIPLNLLCLQNVNIMNYIEEVTWWRIISYYVRVKGIYIVGCTSWFWLILHAEKSRTHLNSPKINLYIILLFGDSDLPSCNSIFSF